MAEPTEIYLPERGFGPEVEVQGAEVAPWDAESRLLRVRGESAAAVTVVLTPAR